MSPVLTAAEMRAAEAAAIAAGTSGARLMEKAGAAAAEAIRRFAGPVPTLVLCGPGNNGGDGYVIARRLAGRGIAVRVAASAGPATPDARAARAGWTGPVEPIEEAAPAPLLVDSLFGTGLTRPLDDALHRRLAALAGEARLRVAVDLPSGIATDDGRILSPVPDFDLTVTFAALKPSHLLQPAARHMGRIAVADIGIAAESRLHALARPRLAVPGPDDHKYRRGLVVVLGGDMPGAAGLAATAALRAGAGYVRLAAPDFVPGLAGAIVQAGAALDDKRIGAVVLGPGLGRGARARELLEAALAAPHPLIFDADALTLIAEVGVARLHEATHPPILTPHQGEYERLFPGRSGSKVERARAAAAEARAVILLKGADTLIAAPDGRAAIAAGGPAWLASAGTGDVLAGIVAAMRSRGLGTFEAACAAVWLHGRSAQLAGPGLIADDLPGRLAAALRECR